LTSVITLSQAFAERYDRRRSARRAREDRDSMSLADEAKAAIAPAPGVGRSSPGAIRAERVRAARSRLLPYVVGGGALSYGYLSVVVAKKDDLGAVYGAAVTAGILAGMTVGWVLLALYRRRVERSAIGRRRTDLAIVLLTVPAYAVAGWVSAWVGWIVAVALSRPTPEPGPPNAWGLLIWAAVVIYPLSYAFARHDLDRPDDFVGALLATKNEIREAPRTRMVIGDFLIGLAWFIGSLFLVFGVVIGVQVLMPSVQVADAAGPWLGVAFLIAWLGLTVAGTAWTLRWAHRRRSRPS
jgi:uncharacterized BrkB/YihY/UPF0761 family membrane protein